jgi:uncharacterized protein
MKFVLLVLAVLALVWLWRGGRSRSMPPPASKPSKPPAAADVQAMVTCAHCGIHLPPSEALPGRGGVFCGEPHRTAFEQSHPAP